MSILTLTRKIRFTNRYIRRKKTYLTSWKRLRWKHMSYRTRMMKIFQNPKS